jgi:hypothetical protein
MIFFNAYNPDLIFLGLFLEFKHIFVGKINDVVIENWMQVLHKTWKQWRQSFPGA